MQTELDNYITEKKIVKKLEKCQMDGTSALSVLNEINELKVRKYGIDWDCCERVTGRKRRR